MHVWSRSSRNEEWLASGHAATNRAFAEEDLLAHLDVEGVSSAIVVQSQDSLDETCELLELADRQPRVAGIVGYLPLADPTRIDEVRHLLSARGLVGVRSLTPIDLSSSVVAGHLEAMAEANVVLELVGEPKWVLTTAVFAATDYPQLTVVIDHLANVRLLNITDIRSLVWMLVTCANVFAKVSGMGAMSQETFDSYVELFRDVLGPDRLLFGSDWPICLRHGAAHDPLTKTRATIASRVDGFEDGLFAATALRAYPKITSPRASESRR